MDIFPQFQGENLEKQKVSLPRDLIAEKNILLVAFQRWHQSLVDSWTGPLKTRFDGRSDICIYEIPVLPDMNAFSRFFIDTAMRRAIPDKRVRETTITLYVDREQLLAQLKIPSLETIIPMVVQKDGAILWRGRGEYDEGQFVELVKAVG